MAPSASTIASEDQQLTVWHNLNISEAIATLQSDAEFGLISTTATQRLNDLGANELTAKKSKPWWWKFLLQFNQPLLIILLCAGLVKALSGSFVNAGVIWGVTTTNAIIGFIQEAKAESAIAALAKAITTEATVIRDGQKLRIPSRELVPGDLVFLTSGDKVPADLRIIQVKNLQVDESALTGESVAIEKNIKVLKADTGLAERKNMAYAGGFVTFGQGTGVVVATGNTTETGRISQLMEQHTDISTPLTRKFDKFSQNWLYMVLGLATLCFAVGLSFRGLQEALEAAVTLTVSAIPEGLPAVVTVTLAIGVSRMARRNAIIRKLPAVETLGSATVICSDKTGTLTENQMTVQAIYTGGHQYTVSGVGYTPTGEILEDNQPANLRNAQSLQECLIAGLLCNDSNLEQKNGQWVVMGDPTEGALIVSANKAGFNQASCIQEMPRLDGIPFESDFQYMATLHATPEGKVIYVKGSVESILQRCSLMLNADGKTTNPLNSMETLQQSTIEREVTIMARQGLRVLAVAKKPVSSQQNTVDHPDIANGLIFLGLQGMIDPPRESAIKAVQACQSAGIQVKMITGDHAITASAIARRMGINKNGSILAFTGTDLAHMDKIELAQVAEEGVVFARVAPEQKLRLVEALQSKGEVVAMTGDGVNDAPALKQADIGIAMGGAGTEVAKEAADMLLTDDNFASIEAAIEEGRAVYKNLLKAICFILPVNGGESMTILISTLFARDLPILSLQVLWLNMLNSITMTVPLAFEPKAPNVMQQAPRQPNEPLLSKTRVQRILAISLFNWIVIFGVFEYIRQTTGNIDLARTMAINSLIAGRIFYLLSISQLVPNLIAKMDGTIQENVDIPAIGFGILGAIILQVIFAHVPLINEVFETAPLSLQQWLFCLGVGSPMILWAALVNKFDPPN